MSAWSARFSRVTPDSLSARRQPQERYVKAFRVSAGPRFRAFADRRAARSRAIDSECFSGRITELA
jgi:hypothetical protein